MDCHPKPVAAAAPQGLAHKYPAPFISALLLIFRLIILVILPPSSSIWKDEIKDQDRSQCRDVPFLSIGAFCFGFKQFWYITGILLMFFCAAMMMVRYKNCWVVKASIWLFPYIFAQFWLIDLLAYSTFPDVYLVYNEAASMIMEHTVIFPVILYHAMSVLPPPGQQGLYIPEF